MKFSVGSWEYTSSCRFTELKNHSFLWQTFSLVHIRVCSVHHFLGAFVTVHVMCARAHTHTRAHARTPTQARTRTRWDACAHTHTRTHTPTHTHTHTHTQAHTHHTNTHADGHTYIHTPLPLFRARTHTSKLALTHVSPPPSCPQPTCTYSPTFRNYHAGWCSRPALFALGPLVEKKIELSPHRLAKATLFFPTKRQIAGVSDDEIWKINHEWATFPLRYFPGV